MTTEGRAAYKRRAEEWKRHFRAEVEQKAATLGTSNTNSNPSTQGLSFNSNIHSHSWLIQGKAPNIPMQAILQAGHLILD